jgi:peptidoglycan hydrolase-like amidase
MKDWIGLLCAALLSCPGTSAEATGVQKVDIGVLGIFHPEELMLGPGENQELLISGAGQEFFVATASNCREVRIRAAGNELVTKCGAKEMHSKEIQASGRNQDATSFVLAIPGKIRRVYRGTLRVIVRDGVLIPVIEMNLETAVGSVVRAEMTEDTPLEALKAQAVATRSYFTAGGGRHADFDFCDLTHCQFLRDPPAPDSPAAKAVEQTREMTLSYNGKPVVAMFTRSCSGHTRTPKEIGLPEGTYPYFSVVCDFCYKKPVKWSREVSSEDAALLRTGEAGRLNVGRRLGWGEVPSNNFIAHQEAGGKIVLEGRGQGHGVGLCQRGARAMAENGATFREILQNYFPNTRIVLGRTTL